MMFTAKPRALPWSLRESAVIETETPDDATPSGVFVWPSDPDEKTIVLFELSLNEYNALSSTIDVGRDIAYGDDSTRLWWLWIRNMVQVPSFCERMIECITTNPATRDALVQTIIESTEFQEAMKGQINRLTEPQIEGKIFTGDCDNSVVAGRVIQIVNTIDAYNIDFLEVIEVGTNDEERVAAVIAAIPGLSESPVEDVLNILQTFLEDFTENYSAAVTIPWKLEVSEGLWCLALQQPDCSLTYEQIFEYFRARIGAEISIQSVLQNIVQFIINGDFSTDEFVASGMYLIFLGFVLTTREFSGITLPEIGAIVRDASPSSAWEDWEPCAAEWCFTQDLTSDVTNIVLDYVEDGFTYTSEFVSGVGVIGARAGLLDENIIKYVLPAPARIISVQFEIDVADNTNAFWYLWPNGLTSGPNGTLSTGANAPLGEIDTDCDFFMFGVDRSGGLRTSIGALTSVTIRGRGENPFSSSNC